MVEALVYCNCCFEASSVLFFYVLGRLKVTPHGSRQAFLPLCLSLLPSVCPFFLAVSPPDELISGPIRKSRDVLFDWKQ